MRGIAILRWIDTITAIVAPAMVVGFVYFFLKLLKKRQQVERLPQPPMPSPIWGHLKIAGELQKLFPRNTHAQVYANYIRKKYNLGDVFYVDWWPLGPRFVYIADPELSSQYLTTSQSLPKSPLETDFLVRFLGKNNMVSVEGAHWKTLRSIFNPGFSASHLMTLVPYIVDACIVFTDKMREKAQKNELFRMEEDATRLTIDIIGKVVLDTDFNSQKELHPIVESFRERTVLMGESPILPILEKLKLVRKFKLWINGRQLDRMIGEELDRKMALRKENEESKEKTTPFKDRKRSVIDLALDAYQQEDAKSIKQLRGGFRQNAIDAMKTFIFAGHDTTSSTIAWMLYLLHVRPRVHKKLVAELNAVFGESCNRDSIASAIKSDPHIINKLEYMTAVIKETMRIFPPASTLRKAPPPKKPSEAMFMVDSKTGAKYPLQGWHAWPLSHLIGRNEAFFPSPEDFIPERFIQSQTPFPEAKLFTPAGKDASRPFEKGPRNCIGQELAMVEVRVIAALVVKGFDFVPEYDGKRIDEWTPISVVEELEREPDGNKRQTVEGHRCYQILAGSAKPAGGIPGRIYAR